MSRISVRSEPTGSHRNASRLIVVCGAAIGLAACNGTPADPGTAGNNAQAITAADAGSGTTTPPGADAAVEAGRVPTTIERDSGRSSGAWPIEPLLAEESDGAGGTIQYSPEYRSRMGTSGRGVVFCRGATFDVRDPVLQIRARDSEVTRARLVASPIDAETETAGGMFGTGQRVLYRTYDFEILESATGTSLRAGATLSARTELRITSLGLGGVAWITQNRALPSGAASSEIAGSEWLVVTRADGSAPPKILTMYPMSAGRLAVPARRLAAGSTIADANNQAAAEGPVTRRNDSPKR